MPGKYIYRNDGEPTDYNRICDENINQSIMGFIIRMTVIMLSFVGAVIGPFHSFVYDGTLFTLYSLKLPYFNRDPYTEFIINVVWQFLTSLVACVGVFVVEGSIMILNDAITVSSKLCCLELNELSEYLEVNYGPNAEIESSYRLKKIFMKIAYSDEYAYFFAFCHLFILLFKLNTICYSF